MAIFNPTTPFELDLSASEESQRATSIAATGSPSPVPFSCITPVPAIYTHVGHAAQYGAGRRNGRTIRLVILHVTDVDGKALGAAAYDARRPDSVSATAFVGPEGEIVYDVPEKDRPYTTGRWNDESVTCEIVGKAAWTDAQWRARPDQLEAIIRIIVDWCKRYSMPARWLTADEVAVGASREGSTPSQGFNYGVTDHYTANQAAIALGGSAAKYSHVDVGPALRAIAINELIPEAARRMAPAPTPTPDPTPAPENDMQLSVMTLTNTQPPTSFLGYSEPHPDGVNQKFWKVLWIDGNDLRMMKMLKDQIAGGAKEYKFGEHVSVALFYENDSLPTSVHADGRAWSKSDWGYAPNVL